MEAGALDRRITLLRGVPSRSALNTKIPTWVPVATVWAKFTPVSDGERVRAQQTGARLDARFLIRWSSRVADVSAAWEIDFEGARYGITGVKPVGRREGLELSACVNGGAT